MTINPIYPSSVSLRCARCGRKTDHMLIEAATTREGETEETYECKECGKTKKIFELASMVQLHSSPLSQQPTAKKGKSIGVRTRIASLSAVFNSDFTISVFSLVLACFFSLVLCQPHYFVMAKNFIRAFYTHA